ncbi:collagen alpha-2(V) chain-like [Equus quagga]|uniref:collagen alpha-2(V) chain-like n=1 Tax=Equus quagga TaxID=89248 RepID=UPI001EE1BA7F|nr:collagen alpha-2(V) chain-like [Equus quagga]
MGQRAWCGCPTGLHLCDLGAGSRAAGPLAWGPLGPAGVCVHVCTRAWLLLFLVDSSWTGETALHGGYWPPFSRADWGRPTPRRPRSRGRGQPKLGCAPPVPPGSGDQVGLGSTSFMAGGHTSFCKPWDKCVLCCMYLIGWHRGARAVGEPVSRYSATPQLCGLTSWRSNAPSVTREVGQVCAPWGLLQETKPLRDRGARWMLVTTLTPGNNNDGSDGAPTGARPQAGAEQQETEQELGEVQFRVTCWLPTTHSARLGDRSFVKAASPSSPQPGSEEPPRPSRLLPGRVTGSGQEGTSCTGAPLSAYLECLTHLNYGPAGTSGRARDSRDSPEAPAPAPGAAGHPGQPGAPSPPISASPPGDPAAPPSSAGPSGRSRGARSPQGTRTPAARGRSPGGGGSLPPAHSRASVGEPRLDLPAWAGMPGRARNAAPARSGTAAHASRLECIFSLIINVCSEPCEPPNSGWK